MIDKGSVIVKMPKYVYNIITNYMADGNLDDVDYLLWELLEELMMGKGPTVDDAEFRERVSMLWKLRSDLGILSTLGRLDFEVLSEFSEDGKEVDPAAKIIDKAS